MKFTLVPEYRFDTYDQVTAEFLLSIGVKGVLLDIDNTLEPYEHPLPGERVLKWLNSLRSVGIKTAIVSNNDEERVDTFNKQIGMPAYSKAGKPFAKNLRRAMIDIGTSEDDTIFMGDQILTDVWAAHNAGIRAILVPPINDRRDTLTRFKRILEKPILKLYEKGNNR
ncbi:MAG: YqeG family HAD IIIA-type phosphatase [Clostridia bacterium]|nr:YqeG family HAD IIIA-type phosphatase [Clostridia bacterium]